MSWLNNTQAEIAITIDGTDFSPEFTGGQITDGSAINTGAVLTSGTLNFAELPLEANELPKLEDYQKSKFGRGKVVIITIKRGGSEWRHPRGYLYIIDSTYDMEARELSIDVGCLLTLHNITDEIGSLSSLTDFTLPGDSDADVEVATFRDLLQAIAAEGKFIWQKNDGSIEKREFFRSGPGDDQADGMGSAKEPGLWTSVRDETALAVQPLSNGSPVPDQIKVTYSWEVSEGDGDSDVDPETGYPIETDYTESTYYLEHPANIKKIQTICTTNPQGIRTCREVSINAAKEQLSVIKNTESIRYYGGPGGSVSTEITITKGPAVEMNGGYYGELYAFQLARAGGDSSQVNLGGVDQIIQTKTQRDYEYGPGGEVLKQVDRQFKNYLGAMTQNDWRSGSAEGGLFEPESPLQVANRGFLTDINSITSSLYLDRITTTTYDYYDDKTVQFEETLTSSAACNGVGIYPPTGDRVLVDIGADKNGVRTTVKRTSSGGLLNPDQPIRNPGTANVTTKSAVYVDETSKYPTTPAGAIVLSTNIPYSQPGLSESEAREVAANYARILRSQLEGDSAGIRIAEQMRKELLGPELNAGSSNVASAYFPGMPFTYHDRTYDATLKLRMNSTGWALAQGESIFSTEGCLVGRSNGQVTDPVNVDAATLVEAFKPVAQQQGIISTLQEELQAISDDCQAKADLMAQVDAELAGR